MTTSASVMDVSRHIEISQVVWSGFGGMAVEVMWMWFSDALVQASVAAKFEVAEVNFDLLRRSTNFDKLRPVEGSRSPSRSTSLPSGNPCSAFLIRQVR